MVALFSHADALREYLTGAVGDGAAQVNPALSLGGYRSATEAVSLGISISSPISGVLILYAGGGNPVGAGTLIAVDANHLTWQPAGAANAGPPCNFSGINDVEVVEGPTPGQYLRVQATTPLIPGQSTITLSYLADNVFSLIDVPIAAAQTGINEYRATMVRNESSNPVTAFQRWIGTLGTQQISNNGQLSGAGGPGTIITSGSFSSWPNQGWCQIQTAGGLLKEVVYYSARTNTQLTVPGNGREQLGTSFAAGLSTDLIIPVPPVAIGIDPTGAQAFGTSIQQVGAATSAPGGVFWSMGVTAASGLQIGTLLPAQQVGIWIWRQMPAGVIATPQALVQYQDSFNAY
jgi:hypothetical protein